MHKKPFLNTVIGSWMKVFLTAVMIQMMNNLREGMTIASWNRDTFWDFTSAGLFALLPVIINFFNPNDTRYGINKEKPQ